MSLHNALGGMRNIAQWFLWKLEWDASAGKYKKTPWAGHAIDASLPASWSTYDAAHAALTEGYALGFWLTADCGYWFLDLDNARDVAFADQMVAAFPGCLVEWSSSGKGLHVIGRAASVPAHRTRPLRDVAAKLLPLSMEFYHEGRGIAFGLCGDAIGSADTDCTGQVAALCAAYFPPRAANQSEGVRAEWRGPSDDEELVRRILGARVSAESAFGGKATVRQLWEGSVDKCSEHDMALASHLAFWTGCDAERMERLMRKSGLVRDKWNEHRTYLRELTIANAIAGCSAVYQEPARSVAVQNEMYGVVSTMAAGQAVITAEMTARVRELLGVVSACGTIEDMHNLVVPQIHAAMVPGAYQEQLVRAVNTKLEFFDSKLPIAKVRALLFPPMIAGARGNDAPAWVLRHCYVKEGDFFYDCENGARMTYQGFNAEYSRLMPMRENGMRESPIVWAFERWGITTVHRLSYRPDMAAYFSWDGLDFANEYSPASVPVVANAYSAAGLAGIDALQRVMFDMCGKRESEYLSLLYWLAHNVQKPGVKLRWGPIIKGTPGDAKTIITNVLRSAMGYRNVGVTGNNTIRNTGGFDDWKVGCAVNFIEEIYLTGKERYQLYNAMKDAMSNDVININAKGNKTYQTWNITNHGALTNHNDAIPLEPNDRRWFVIFTPWNSLTAMYAYCGLSEDQWRARIKAIDVAWRGNAAELRAWFLSLPIPAAFDPDGSAPLTPERLHMMASSRDDVDGIAETIIQDGAHGITGSVLSSSCLSALLKNRSMIDGFELPRSTALNHMLTRMGYSKLSKQVKWNGQTHTVWVRDGFTGDNEAIRIELDNSKPNPKPL